MTISPVLRVTTLKTPFESKNMLFCIMTHVLSHAAIGKMTPKVPKVMFCSRLGIDIEPSRSEASDIVPLIAYLDYSGQFPKSRAVAFEK